MILFKRVTESFRHIEGARMALLALETARRSRRHSDRVRAPAVGPASGAHDRPGIISSWSACSKRAKETVASLRRDTCRAQNTVAAVETVFATAPSATGQCPPESRWKAVGHDWTRSQARSAWSVYQEMHAVPAAYRDPTTPTCADRVAHFHARRQAVSSRMHSSVDKRTDPHPDR